MKLKSKTVIKCKILKSLNDEDPGGGSVIGGFGKGEGWTEKDCVVNCAAL